MKEVVLDTETTGISVKDGHRIVEIGCIELDNLIPTKNKFHCYLNPERKVSEKALEVHGYTDDFLASQKKFSDVGEQFLEFIECLKSIQFIEEKDIDDLQSGKLQQMKKASQYLEKKNNELIELNNTMKQMSNTLEKLTTTLENFVECNKT